MLRRSIEILVDMEPARLAKWESVELTSETIILHMLLAGENDLTFGRVNAHPSILRKASQWICSKAGKIHIPECRCYNCPRESPVPLGAEAAVQ